ncbi:MAG: DsrE family protein [Alphaproteobacteria bacterium]
MFKKVFKTLAIVLALGGMTVGLSACATKEEAKVHKIVFHVDDNDKQKMNITLNNAANVDAYYKDKGEEVIVEIVAYGPGLNMFVKGKSPVAKRIDSFKQNFDNISFKACGNTMKKMAKKSGKPVKLFSNIDTVPAGVVHLSERQEQGWTYIRP